MVLKKDGFKGQHSIVLPTAIKDTLKSNELTSLLYLTDMGFYPNAKDHYIARHNGVDQNILIFCVDGKGWVSIDGKKQDVNKGQFFIIEANTPHSYGASAEAPWSIYWLHYTGRERQCFQPIHNKVIQLDQSAGNRIEDQIKIFEEIFKNLEMGYSPDNLGYVSACLWHFLASFRFNTQYCSINQDANNDVIQIAINYMLEHLQKKITLEELASHAGYSASRFGLLFKEKTGQSPLSYLCQLKIRRACQMLDMTNMKIKEITEELGFYDQYHFSKTFLKLMGETPTQYKKRVKG